MTAELPLEISVHDLKHIVDAKAQGVRVVDVREAWEIAICAIPGAEPMPLSEFARHVVSLDASQSIYLVCHHGARSLNAALWLRRNGFPKAASVRGGIDAWSIEIDPATPRY